MSEKVSGYEIALLVLLGIGVMLALLANWYVGQIIKHEHELGGLAVVDVRTDWFAYLVVTAASVFMAIAFLTEGAVAAFIAFIGLLLVVGLPLAVLGGIASTTMQKLSSVIGHDVDLDIVKKFADEVKDYGFFQIYVLYYDTLKKLERALEQTEVPKCLIYCPASNKPCLEKCEEAYRYCSEVLKLSVEQVWKCVDLYLRMCGPDRVCILFNIGS